MNILYCLWCMQELFEVESQRREKLSSKLEVTREPTDHPRYPFGVILISTNVLIWLLVISFVRTFCLIL